MTKKRYQVYLNPHSVGILDEAAELSGFSRSQFIREAIDAAASRFGNLLATIRSPKTADYSWLDEMTGVLKVEGKETVNISERVDDIYYDK